jgi:hypothetical protein
MGAAVGGVAIGLETCGAQAASTNAAVITRLNRMKILRVIIVSPSFVIQVDFEVMNGTIV